MSAKEEEIITCAEANGLALYEEEYLHRPRISQAIRSLSIYSPLQPGIGDVKPKKANMGTFIGVFLPCIQNIFGVLFFIRLAWIVGMAGLVESFFIVLICCLVTFTTSISLSAIATNGMVPAGGPYYMISRNLGPELGGAVGILFYLATTVAASMYITGAAEIFLLYLVPTAKIFDDMSNCFRLYGSCVLLFLAFVVMAGVKVVNKFALPTVVVVNLCIILTFIGMFVNFNGTDRLKYCAVGDRIADLKSWLDHNRGDHIKCDGNDLARLFCSNASEERTCDQYFLAMRKAGRIKLKNAILGLSSGIIKDNLFAKYVEEGSFIEANSRKDDDIMKKSDREERKLDKYVFADITTSFIILIGVFFPSSTGIMAGSNRSGDLKDASKSIPAGTLAATCITSFVYLVGTVLMAASVDSVFIRDKFGESAFGRLIVAELAVPHPLVVSIGSFIASTGAGMQSLTGAPRLLQAIASDGVIPILDPLQKTTSRGEPLRAILVTLLICELGILIAALESITALISQFFLMCYLGVNTACALQSLLKAPSWRPRFRYYHWVLSIFGSCLCIAVMFMSHWVFAIVAIIIGTAVYKYIEYRGAEKEWGDGIRGLGLSAASYALLNLEEGPLHTKNWRPQLLVLCKTTTDHRNIQHEKLLSFASQLKAGKGLTVIATVVPGHFINCVDNHAAAEKTLIDARKKHKIKGFCETLVFPTVAEGLSALIQTSGLGGLKHNTVVIKWPKNWNVNNSFDSCQQFVDTLRVITAAKCATVVVKNVDNFPDSKDRVTGYLDIWWVVHDGGLLLLLPFLLKQNKTWNNCRLRIYTVAQPTDNLKKMKDDLRKFVYQLRISAEVDVVEMQHIGISEATYERTKRVSQRLQETKDSDNDRGRLQVCQEHMTKRSSQDFEPQTIEAREAEGNLTAEHFRRMPPPPSPSVLLPCGKHYLEATGPSGLDSEVCSQCVEIGTNDLQLNHMDLASTGMISKASATKTGIRRASLPFSLSTPKIASKPFDFLGSKAMNLRRMHTAVRLNDLIRTRSTEAQLIFVNLPQPPRVSSEEYYMEFIEALTEGLNQVVLVKGSGTEVVTIYS